MEGNIKIGDFVIIQRQKYTKLFKFSNAECLAMLGKEQIELKEILGKPFWTTFKMVPKGNIKKRIYSLEPCEQIIVDVTSSGHDILESGVDNRNIVDDGQSQSLSKEEIEELRYVKGTGSKEMLQQLIGNSKTFNSKTEFSQQKYLKRKETKYFEYIQIRKPTIRHLAEMFYRQDPDKIMGLRKDSLSQILMYSNIQSCGTYLLYDSGSTGLLTAAILNSIGQNTNGKLIHMHPGNFAQKQGIAAMNFEEDHLNRCISVNVYSVLRQFYQRDLDAPEEPPQKKIKTNDIDLDPVERKPKWFYENEQACLLLDEKVDGLIISSKEQPRNLINNFIRFVKPSCPIVIFNQSQKILADIYIDLKSTSKVTGLRLTSSWLRNYQVLPNRTHPEVMMCGNSGFLLCGTVVE